MVNLRDKILSSKDIKEEMMTIPEWDVTVNLKGMTGQQRSELLQECMGTDGKVIFARAYPLIIVNSVFDPDTQEKVFNKKDIGALNKKSGGILERIALKCFKLSGLSKEDFGDIEKN